ncbi:hypothetical protein MBRU_12580 [Mycolicibacterium brumae DSM 44177]|nr:hypothetical protein MBRU_12580 [Mycolicibacterium brumae DSM 44177]
MLRVNPGGEQQTHDALGGFAGDVRALRFRIPDSRLSLVVGIGSRAWDRLFSGPKPAKLHDFVELRGSHHHAPSTGGDLLLHIKAASVDMCFELGGRLLGALGDAVTVLDEVQGFKFFDMRDLLGFVDGTENPVGAQAAAAVRIGDADPAFADGCYVHVQRYTHDMAAWNALTVTEQELVIGRTKLEDIELDDEVKPANSHVAVNVITDDDGSELKIVRANMPFGSLADGVYGTYYIAYAGNPDITERMLRRMFIGEPVGNTDRILDFSTAHTGAMFFVPTADFLGSPPPLPRKEQSLSIGSLKGQQQ